MPTLYIGIDPGIHGGIAALSEDGGLSATKLYSSAKGADTDSILWQHILSLREWCDKEGYSPKAVIEQQTARPTNIPDGNGGWRQTVLASTVILYGQYKLAIGMLMGASIPIEYASPKKWQGWFNISKTKGETGTKWKNRLKDLAQSLYRDQVIVTLATADAILLATYAKSSNEMISRATRASSKGIKK